ncbi:MAG: hypothetical protein M1836_001498 [Candelina mexicana]|nr:MAG: hypothetical protein M1836_001498 [Candelina mexicana]
MTDRQPNGLQYGHFGEALYDASNKQWQFSRRLSERSIIQPLGPSKTSASATNYAAAPGQHQSSGVLSRQAQFLARSHPVITPAVSLLPALADISEAVVSLTSDYDPIISSRFTLGNALDARDGVSSSKTIPIAAMAGGTNGDALKIVQIREDWFGWRGDRSVTLSVYEVEGAIGGWWTGDGGAIQQICFAEKAGAGTTWLAVRLSRATAILRPLLRDVSIPASGLEFGRHSKNYPPSPLDANTVLTLPVSRTGGIPHADVTFNPWDERQFAIVDQEGFWGVWRIEDYRDRVGSAYAGAGRSGHIFDGTSDDQQSIVSGQADGWGKLCWIADGNALLICNRRHLAIFDLKALKPARLRAPNIGLARSSDWILDMKRSPAHDNQVIILTSSRMFWLEITGAGENNEDVRDMSGGSILLSLRHYREGNDISLSLQLMPLNEEDILVLIYSHRNKLVNTFQLSISLTTPSIPMAVSKPCLLELPKDLLSPLEQSNTISSSGKLAISALALVPLELKVNARFELGGLGSLYLDHDVRFFRLLVQLNDLSVRCCLYSSGVPSSGWQRESDRFQDVVSPTLQVKNAARIGQSATRVGEDDFVVEDDLHEVLESRNKPIGRLQLQRKKLTRRQPASRGHKEDPWTVDSQLFYDLASGDETTKPNIIGGLELPGKQDFGQYLATLNTRLERKAETSFSPFQSLLELTSTKPHVKDLSEEALYMDESLQAVLNDILTGETGSTIATLNLVLPSMFGSPNELKDGGPVEGFASLSDMYRRLLKDWVTPISDDVPGRTRIAKAKIAAQVAAEISLASIGVSLRPTINPAPVLQAEPASPLLSTFNLPVRARLPSPTGSSASKGKQRESPPYPTPQPSSLGLPATPSSESAGTAFLEDPASTRLRAYTSLTPQPQLPSSLSNIICQWQPGADPATHSWTPPRFALAEPRLDEDDVEARERTNQRKKQERLLKRQRTATLDALIPESQRLYGSQPTLAIRPLISSQPTVEEDRVPMSQTERGPHGGRPGLEKPSRPATKKQKVPGF